MQHYLGEGLVLKIFLNEEKKTRVNVISLPVSSFLTKNWRRHLVEVTWPFDRSNASDQPNDIGINTIQYQVETKKNKLSEPHLTVSRLRILDINNPVNLRLTNFLKRF